MFGKTITFLLFLAFAVAFRGDGPRANVDGRVSVVRNHWICARKDAPVYFPHDTDCTRYYMCDCADAYEYTCDTGLRFNPQALECDLAARVDCAAGGVTYEEGESTHPPIVVVQEIPSEAEIDSRCPSPEAGPHAVEYWAHESNCATYFRCAHGQVKELHCAEGLVWDNALKGCGPPNPYKCCAAVPSAPTLREENASNEEAPSLWGRLQSWMG